MRDYNRVTAIAEEREKNMKKNESYLANAATCEELKRSSTYVEAEKVCQRQLEGILITFYSSANKIALCDAKCQQH